MRVYLALRRLLAWRTPQYAQAPVGAALQADIADMVAIVTDAQRRGIKVWFIEFPNNMGQAMDGKITADWRAALAPLGVGIGGHAMRERACWGFTDTGHPSEAGANAIAQVMAEVIGSGTALSAPSDAPRCDTGPEAGPGKPGW